MDKKWKALPILLALAVLLVTLCACAPSGGESAPAAVSSSQAPDGLRVWSETETPVKLRYDRLWEYSAAAETEDAAVIADIVAALESIRVGQPSEWMVTDYTDVLCFTFADGHSLRLEFEGECWVSEDGKRYEAEGLDTLRSRLDGLMEPESLP